MSVLCPTNLTVPWQPLSDNHVFKKVTILALIAAILMFSDRIFIFTFIVATIYHLGTTAH